MKRPVGIAPRTRHAAIVLLSVAAFAGLLLSSTIPAFAPAAAFGPARTGAAGTSAWAGLIPEQLRPATDVLPYDDAALYRKILRLQKTNDLAGADALIARLADKRLMGHVLADRYLGSKRRASGKQLSGWLAAYRDHPNADRIYRLAAARSQKPKSKRVKLQRPVAVDLGSYRASRKERVAMTRAPTAGQLTPAQRFSQYRIEPEGDLAAKFYYGGKSKKALTLATANAAKPTPQNPRTHWTAGLAAWRLGRFTQAGKHFETVARAKSGDDWSRSAGAFWAARAHLADRRPTLVNKNLRMAAAYPRTFYGLLATRALGRMPAFNWDLPAVDGATLAPLLTLPAGRRALALLQIGENDRAEAELRALAKGGNRALTRAILAAAEHARMPGLLFRMGRRLRDRGGRPFDSALYPIPNWEPSEGFSVDRAVIFAIMRQESQFKPEAQSPVGARGLMQIMPVTASYVSGDKSFKAGAASRLFDPDLNVSLGQRYIRHLLKQGEVGGDLFRLTAAYNGGIGNILRWQKGKSDDPLLFIESITFRETRAYVERVLANVWMYRLRLGQDTPSLDALAAGEWPMYQSLEVFNHRTASPLQTASLGY